jgi:hypothetical protein
MKTLKEVYNFNSKNKPKIVKVLEKARRLIEAEEAAPAEEAKSVGKIGDKPRGDSVDKATNVKDVDPIEMANQLLSGDDDAPLVASTKGEWFQTSGAEAKAWIEEIGPETFVQRLKALASKVPTTGLPKSVMPFLPGPKDAKGKFSDVEDALTPGGEYNVDTHEESGTGETEEKTKDKNESLVRGAEYMLIEKSPPPAANTFLGMDGGGAEFMKAGLEDGDPRDDTITVTKGGSLAAADAKPTQSNILIFKGLGMAMNPKNKISGGDLGAWAGVNGEILDGHHRWAATMFNDPTASMGLAGQVDLQGLGGGNEQEVLKYLTAIGNALGNKTKVPKKESRVRNNKDKLIIERWNKLAGLLND